MFACYFLFFVYFATEVHGLAVDHSFARLSNDNNSTSPQIMKRATCVMLDDPIEVVFALAANWVCGSGGVVCETVAADMDRCHVVASTSTL